MEIQAKEDMDMQKKWWHDKVAYQIYPKSFCDTNGARALAPLVQSLLRTALQL